ncbi:MAG: FMN-binding glutamate synthase family protein [Alphaproteobacteria bacterium]|nr:FMN-binding glutamate synthase family protein [Alphaproteobacteria bacterium]
MLGQVDWLRPFLRFVPFALCATLSVVFFILWVSSSGGYFWLFLAAIVLTGMGVWDYFQERHNLMRNYPVAGRLRWVLEGIRPQIRQYFIESDIDGAPFNRNERTLVYERAKNIHAEEPFGTERDVYAPGYEWFAHSIAPVPASETHFRVDIGGPGCSQPYAMALLNVSAMSFGALSANAISALNLGAKLGGFAHDTGEGGLTDHHLEHGGDLIWEIASGYFGCRTADGKFDPDKFKVKVNVDSVKCVSIKLSQGAKPGLGGVMPAAKVTPEIARIRGVPVGVKCISPPYHTAFSTPRELIEFVAKLRELANGRPTGFKFCVGHGSEFLGICKAMIDLDVYPDFVIVDGGEGGTGAAPLEFENHVGSPLTEGLIFVNNALVGCNLRDHIKIGCSGKINSGFAIAQKIAQGADYCNAARAMMFALGCVQSQKCQTNRCPTGVATQDPRRSRAIVVPTKADRVHQFQRQTVESFNEFIAAMGLDDPSQLKPSMLFRRVDEKSILPYSEIYSYLEPGELLGGTSNARFRQYWEAADPDRFRTG